MKKNSETMFMFQTNQTIFIIIDNQTNEWFSNAKEFWIFHL